MSIQYRNCIESRDNRRSRQITSKHERGTGTPILQPYTIAKGKPPIKIDPTAKLNNVEEVRKHFREIMKLANFKQLVTAYIFENIASELDYSFKTYCVDEVGYKLSKRNEKARPNQLCRFTISGSKKNVPNLHLVDENTEIKIDTNKPKTVLDYIKRDVVWE